MTEQKHLPESKKNRRLKSWRNFGLFFLVSLFALFVTAGWLALNPTVAAQFADSVLRPTLGDQAVIALEGRLFGIEDQINKLTRSAPKANDYATSVATTTIKSPTTAELTSPEATSQPAPEVTVTPTNIPLTINSGDSLAGEGIWSQITNTSFFTTFIRTDPDRPYAVVRLVRIPMKNLGLGAVAGTKYPGGPSGTGKVPDSINTSGKLLAAFNGGFKGTDGHYGMIVDGVTYVPLRSGIPVLTIDQNGTPTINQYSGQALASDIVAARQNGPLLVSNGKTVPLTSQGIDVWAGTANGDYITWRSGLGITANGDLIYAAGPSLTPTALADALRLAGSQSALQLDINPFWVRFMLFWWNGTSYHWSTLDPALPDGGKAYLNGYEKDFFYIYQR